MAYALDFVSIWIFVTSSVFHGPNATYVSLCTYPFPPYLPHILQGCLSVTEAIVLGKWLWRMWVKLTSTTPYKQWLSANCVDISWDHYNDVTMGSIASQITSLTIVYSAVYSGVDQRKHQSSASLAFVRPRWIPRSNGQLRGKCFHLTTSSWTLFHAWMILESALYGRTRCVLFYVLYTCGSVINIWSTVSPCVFTWDEASCEW